MNSARALLCLALAACACDESAGHEPVVTAERSQAVTADRAQAAPLATPVAFASSASAAPTGSAAPMGSAAPKPRRALCDGKLAAGGHPLSKQPLERRAAPGARELPAKPHFKGLTWVNFWAAWCVPCREEIPRLLEWQQRLTAQGKDFQVLFVSLDDDERQLTGFLDKQPSNGLRATYWLRDGKAREEWLAAAGIEPDPDLPQHLLVDAEGKVRCRVRGAVEDADYAGLTALLGVK